LVANNNALEISKAIAAAKKSSLPTLIEVKTVIGDG
jgi:transketolase